MLGKALGAAALLFAPGAVATGATAQEPAAMEAPPRTAPEPATEPGRAAADAVLNPAATPSGGAVEHGAPPRTGGAWTDPVSGTAPGR